ncbi:hypothetical protein A6X21_00885 [Planctopirus hydrillae]|uniref:Uncharacterized protein n=1 Tax=Planctopirus hydrillae TaxID=1841610 RepID=A0A1C3E4M5_9PLAN|nr:hypothetical protein A6X21_00885 [Planctopirus hydrillae]
MAVCLKGQFADKLINSSAVSCRGVPMRKPSCGRFPLPEPATILATSPTISLNKPRSPSAPKPVSRSTNWSATVSATLKMTRPGAVPVRSMAIVMDSSGGAESGGRMAWIWQVA